MTRYLCLAFSDCKDPAREKEFNDWYSNVHIPDMLEVPGMISATRWVGSEKKGNVQRQYLAMYELETDNLAEFDAAVMARGKRTVQEGRFSDLPVFDPPNIPRMYRQIMPEKKAKQARK